MKKPVFDVEEIRGLLNQLESIDSSTEHLSTVKENLSSHILYSCVSEEGTDLDKISVEAYQGIAAEAYSLEIAAKQLRSIVRAFKKPMIDLPKDMNSDNEIIAIIARWRMKLGK
jgi:hypothetical protein